MTEQQHPELMAEILAFCERTNLSRSAFGEAAVGDPRLIFDMERGRELRRRTMDRVRNFLDNGVPPKIGAPDEQQNVQQKETCARVTSP